MLRKVVAYHLPLLVYAAAILWVSSMPNLKPPDVGLPAVDKLAHFAEYAILALLTYRSISHLSSQISAEMSVLWSLMFLTFFAFADETLQRFIPGRHSDVMDYLTDLLAGVVVLLVIRFWRVCRRGA
jgi:VanZ family protein